MAAMSQYSIFLFLDKKVMTNIRMKKKSDSTSMRGEVQNLPLSLEVEYSSLTSALDGVT